MKERIAVAVDDVVEMIRIDHRILRVLPEESITPEICMALIRRGNKALHYAPDELITPECCFEAVHHDSDALRSAPVVLKTPELYYINVLVGPWGGGLHYQKELSFRQ